MMSTRVNRNLVLNAPAVIGLLIIGIAGFFDLQDPTKRWIAFLLLLAFGLLFFTPPYKRLPQAVVHLFIGLMTACVAGLILLEPGWGFFPILFFILSPTVFVHFPLRTAILWNVVFALVTGVMLVLVGGWSGLLPAAIYVSGFVFFGSFGYMMVQSDRDRKLSERLLAELQEAHRKLQDYTGQLEELAIAQERNRIAREMHDTLGHRLTIAAVQLEGAQRLVRKDPERAETMIATVREQVREGLSDLRRTVAMLRASLDEDMPIGQAFEKLADQVSQATGLQIHLSIAEPLPDLPSAYRQALYRAAQEGLTNIQRHAQASEAWLQLACQGDHLTLLVGDNGIGMDAAETHTGFGLGGLRERAALLGGEAFIDPRTGGGTQLSFRLPIPEQPIVPPSDCL